MAQHSPIKAFTLSPSAPLWQRAPSHDSEGKRLSDFMMLIPQLNKQNSAIVEEKLALLHQLLLSYEDKVVFADLNLKMNILWVTIRPVPGLLLELATQVKCVLPEALLVSQRYE